MAPYRVPDNHRLHPLYATDELRREQAEGMVEKDQLVFPIFITDQPGAKEIIGAMPGQFRWGPDRIAEAIEPLVNDGLRAVLIFGVPTRDKDGMGSTADDENTPAIQAVRALRSAFPEIDVMTDVCMCAYTDHGHCGILQDDGSINNDATINRLAEIATAYAQAGANVVAPSDMMDGRVGAIKQSLAEHDLAGVKVMSYAAKFASCYYGPFRDAAKSAPAFGDRRCYQLPPAGRKLALKAVDRDIEEGADIVMVKPAGPYLDMIRETRERVEVPVACYQVSGEYAMIHHAAEAGAFDRQAAIMELLVALRRAGAEILITYFCPDVLQWID